MIIIKIILLWIAVLSVLIIIRILTKPKKSEMRKEWERYMKESKEKKDNE